MANAQTGNYHVDLWNPPQGGDTPPSFVCLLCIPTQEVARLTEEAVHAHLREVHVVEPVPSSMMAALLALYYPPGGGGEAHAQEASASSPAVAEEPPDARSDV